MPASQTTSSLQLLPTDPLRRRVAPPPPGVPVSALPPQTRPLLERLRDAARRARCGRQMSLSEARQCLACPGAASGAAEALVRTLGEVLGRRPRFHQPGAPLASFDEAWLLRCHAAQVARDADSLALLTGRRVPAPLRRSFLDLLRAL